MRLTKYLGVLLIAALFAGCKPTEKNYREAYDAAKAKREAAEAETMIPATGLMSDDGPQLRVVDGDSLYVSRDRLRKVPGEDSEFGKFNVAVGVYKMNTNAKAQASQLTEEGYKAMAAQTTGDRWYTVAGVFETLPEAAEFIRKFKAKHKNYPYIGLPDAPVIVQR